MMDFVAVNVNRNDDEDMEPEMRDQKLGFICGYSLQRKFNPLNTTDASVQQILILTENKLWYWED